MSETKRSVGRPRTTTNDLPDDWKTIIMDSGQEGGSALEARCKLGIAQSAWETLLTDSEDFRVTVSAAASLCQVWWESNGRRLAIEGGGNATIWKFNMQNRFGWSERREVDNKSSDGSMSPKKGLADFYSE
jgi:hypothetical protein